MKEAYIQMAKQLNPNIVADRRYLHQNPEVGMELPGTCRYVADRLAKMGYTAKSCGGGLTVVCGDGGKTILIRADMDALHMKEESDLSFRSKNGNAHMCGHDLHTAILLGAAAILKSQEKDLCGTVKFMFQPGEEVLAGAKAMVEDGILENPEVDAALTLHVLTDREDGLFFYKEGAAFASSDIFKIEIHGRGSHGARPEEGVDALYAMVQVYNQLSGIAGREASMFESAVLSVGQLHAGEAHNIIPNRAVLEGSLRCYNGKVRHRILERLDTVVRGVCSGLGVTCDLTMRSTDEVYNDPAFCREITPYIKDILGDHLRQEEYPTAGSEDFCQISKRVPSLYLLMGVGSPGAPVNHNPKAYFSEDKMYLASAALAYGAAQWLKRSK